VFIPSATSQRIDRSIIAYRDFQQLHSQRQQLKASQTSLFLAVTLASLFGTLWTSIYASRRITIPIKALAEATSKLAEGGYGHRASKPPTKSAADHVVQRHVRSSPSSGSSSRRRTAS
jgi:nitrogen fixation/metabolism regulation signal transduction histidine kinase